MVDFSQIFKATYSGVPVYEMLCKGVAVMRRRSDSYLNATQILKVADFDKPQRTRILEREVQVGEHEKVQGGYGKYQGTWVPFERGKALAELYEVDNVLAPILQFTKGDDSPPLAPKHVTAASTRPRKPRENASNAASNTSNTTSAASNIVSTHTSSRPRKRPKHFDEEVSDFEMPSQSSTRASDHASKSDDVAASSPSVKRARTQKHKEKPVPKIPKTDSIKPVPESSSNGARGQDDMDEDEEDDEEMMEIEMSEKPYAQRLLQYFMSNKTSIPSLFTQPPRDLDLNVIIDDEGHTSLHWAAAMARIKIVKLLIENGADMYRVNYKGQTALMRSVLFTNNFDLKTFDSLLDLLRTTIFNIDKKDQTVFHHTAAMSDWKGKIYASRYYMECLINKLKNNQSELISILNVQDTNGDTALTIAAKIGNRRLIKLMIEAGASTEIANEEGMTPKDYFGDIEKSMISRTSMSSPPPLTTSSSEAGNAITNEADAREILRSKVEAMYRNVNSDAASGPQISEIVDDFLESYEKDLISRERLLQKKKVELDLYKKRLEDTKHLLNTNDLNENDTEIHAIMQKVEIHGKTLESRLKRWLQFSQKETIKLLQDEYAKEEAEGEKPPSPAQPRTIEELQALAESARAELAELQALRKKNTASLVKIQCRLPPKKYQDYKRLISACCNVAYESVEVMLTPLLESFDSNTNVLAGESLDPEKKQGSKKDQPASTAAAVAVAAAAVAASTSPVLKPTPATTTPPAVSPESTPAVIPESTPAVIPESTPAVPAPTAAQAVAPTSPKTPPNDTTMAETTPATEPTIAEVAPPPSSQETSQQ